MQVMWIMKKSLRFANRSARRITGTSGALGWQVPYSFAGGMTKEFTPDTALTLSSASYIFSQKASNSTAVATYTFLGFDVS